MFSRRTDSTIPTETVKGPSLARGPAWIVGLVLSVFGLMMFFEAPGTPLSTAGFPDGQAVGETFLGFEANAWTAWMTTAVGVFVLIGAAQHLAARTFSLIAGIALGVMAIAALIDGDVFGLAAANTLDVIGWAIAGGILLVTALMPRLRQERPVAVTDQDRIADRDRARLTHRKDERVMPRDDERVAEPVAARTSEPVAEHDRHRVTDRSWPADSSAAPGGARSEPLRRTYDGPAQTQAEREREAQAAEDQTRAR